MTYYRLTTDGWVPHKQDVASWQKYYSDQVKGLPTPDIIPIKEAVKQQPPVEIKLVSTVQDAVTRAKAEMEHIKEESTNKAVSSREHVKAQTTKRRKNQKHRGGVQKTKAKTNPRNKSRSNKKSLQFVRKALPQDVWGPAKWR